MAEFVLGRIKFVYRNGWETNTAYVVDDVVTNGGKTYICITNHTSSALFASDYDSNPELSKWNLIADGVQWKADWLQNHYYESGDLVKYGGIVYQCNEAHTSSTYVAPTWLGLEQDSGKWDVFATSFEWKGEWLNGYRYKVNDIVVYGGKTFVCNTKHISAATYTDGLESNSAYWDAFNEGIVYLGEWSDASVRYRVNDVVKYGADLWICTTYHTSSTDFDQSKWSVFVNGFQFESTWDSATVYQIGDVVTYGGYSYIAKTNNTNKTPSSNLSDWAVYTTGFNFVGDWITSTSYKVGDVVRQGGYTYLALADNTSQQPPNEEYWTRLNTGINWKAWTGLYSNVTGTTEGPGINATFTVERIGTAYSVSVVSGGSYYSNGDVITILGEDVGGVTPTNNITVTVLLNTLGSIDAVSYTGFATTWHDAVDYVLGDVVYFGVNSYICVEGHTSALGNRPDADTTATYWNLFTAGAEVATLTTSGDTFFYGPNGPARLPIGRDGQVLRVTNGYPSWESYGHVFNLVYVGPTGTDEPYPNSGFSIDKPWKSIRYACKQVEEGYMNPNAKTLLQINKQFLIKEIFAYINYTYTVTTTGTSAGEFLTTDTSGLTINMPIQFASTANNVTAGVTYYVKTIVTNTSFTVSTTPGGTAVGATGLTGNFGAFVYNIESATRDASLIIDGLIFDLSHGGTQKTTANTFAFYNTSGTDYITKNTGYEIQQFIGSHVLLKSMLPAVLGNIGTAKNYQHLNTPAGGVEYVDQQFNTNYVAEAGAVEKVQALMDILLNGLAEGNTTAIPAAIAPNTTISVKTGTYTEVLPIVVPANTAVVGDELRSTVVQPKAANSILVNDEEKTIGALNRVKELLPNIIANVPVIPTTGNTQVQQYVYNGAESIADSISDYSVRSNTKKIADILANGISIVPTQHITDPVAFDSGLYNARRLIVANKQFLKDEVTSWINVQIAAAGGSGIWNGFVYSQVPCERDVGYIVDALSYDLTYGGNLATQIAARSYYSNGVLVEVGEKAQALALWTYVKSIIDNIATGSAITPSAGNTTLQVVSGTPGSNDAATFAQARIQELHDTINSGTEPTTILPSTSWVAANKVAAATAILADKASIRTKVIESINTNYPTLVYNQVTCSRDIGYIVDALVYDMMFSSDFLSIWNGMSYYRALASTSEVVANQLDATIDCVYYAGSLVIESAKGTDVLTTNLNNMVSILNTGISAAPAFVLPIPTGNDGALNQDTINAFNVDYYKSSKIVGANKVFLQAETSAWMANPANGYNSIWTALSAAQKAACTRDVGYIVDALVFDLTYGGNLATQIAARSYYSNGVLVESPAEKTALLALLAHLDAIIQSIIVGNPVAKSPGNTETQITTNPAGSGFAFTGNRMAELTGYINTQATITPIIPDTTWVNSTLSSISSIMGAATSSIQAETISWIDTAFPDLTYNTTTCSRDVGYIIDALRYDLAFGSNFLSAWNAMSYHRALASTAVVLSKQLQAQAGTIGFVGAALKQIYYGSATTTTGSLAAVSRVVNSANTIYDTVNTGFGAVPSIQFTEPTGYNTSFLIGFGDGKTQLINNYDFIKADVLQYYANGAYGSVWSSTTAEGRDKGRRDIGYILDALQHDMTYGGNYQSLVAGSAYYSSYLLNISAAEKPAFLDLFGFMKTLVGKIVRKDAITAQSGNTVPRVSSGTAGSIDAGSFAEARIQDIIDWITNGSAPTAIDADYSWATSQIKDAYRAVVAKRSEIVLDASAWVQKYYQEVVLDLSLTERDAGLLVDAIAYDMVFGTNFNSMSAGRRYLANTTSTNALLNGPEKNPTLGAIKFIKYKVKNIAANGAVAQLHTTLDDATNSISGGATPRINYPVPNLPNATYVALAGTTLTGSGSSATFNVTRTDIKVTVGVASAGSNYAVGNTIKILGSNIGGVTPSNDIILTVLGVSGGGVTNVAVSEVKDAVVLLEDNRQFIVEEVLAYLAANYSSAPYDKTLTVRDTNYILDALHYDLTYGGDFASQQAGQAYWSFSTSEIGSSVKAATLGAIARISTVAQAVVQNSVVTVTTGNTGSQVFRNGAQPAGSPAVATTIGTLVTKISNYVDLGLTSGAPTLTVTIIATTDTFTSNSHGLQNGDLIVNEGATANGVTSGVTYYVVSASTNTFKLAATYGGTALTTFTNGSGLTLVLHKTNMPYVGWVDSSLITQYTALSAAKLTLQNNVISYINTNYPNLTYDQSQARSDTSKAIDAVGYDFMLDSNFRATKAGEAYNRPQAVALKGRLLASTRESLKYLQTQITDTLSTSATAVTRANAAMKNIIDQLIYGDGEMPEVNGTTSYNNNLGVIKGVEALRANVNFLAYEATAWVNANYGGTVTSTSATTDYFTTSSLHNLSVGDPVKFTFNSIEAVAFATTESTSKITLNTTAGVVVGMQVVFGGTTFGGLSASGTYFVQSVSGNDITVSTSNGGAMLTSISDGNGIMTATIGGVIGGITADVTYYVVETPTTTTFSVTSEQDSATVVGLQTNVGLMIVQYSFDAASCRRDMAEFLNALVYDAQYTGNYKVKRAAELYLNAVNGSELSNMWLVRNSTGIRNITMNGLNGTLSVPNNYGTQRPTAGAYTSLDPGFGPWDSNVWVNSRSCYVQNCSLFGNGATALKIDGALHQGGNRSIVANDYTTFISDGIGVWCTGANSLTELVSVFAYYSYAGYIAELGGKIRATNGNSSYGVYGVIAEGVDTYETPITATLDNRAEDAYITNVMTDGAEQVLRIEFANAGNSYSNASWTISGSGYNAAALGDEFRDYGVFETRLVDLNDGYGYGGTGYLTSTNAAQLSTIGTITIAASDTQLSTAYLGMRVLITAGTGVGQYASILNYNNGSKTALVTRESFATLTVTATAITNNLLTVASTATIYPGMAIYLGSSANGLSANTLYYVRTTGFTGTQFSVSTTGAGGTAVTITATGSVSIPLYAAGWDHVVPGTTIQNSLDLTTTYIIEPKLTYSAPGYTATSRTLATVATWQSVTYAANTFLAIPSGSAATSYSANGTTWSAAGNLPSSTTWADVVYGGGEGATATAVVGGLGGIGAQLQAVLGTGIDAGQVVAVNVIKGGYGYLTPPSIVFASGLAKATAVVRDGEIVDVVVTIPGSGYSSAPVVTARTDIITGFTVTSWGKNYTSPPTITVTGGGSSNQATGTAVLTNSGVSSITVGNNGGSGYTSQPTVTIVDPIAKFVAVPSTASGGTTKAAYQTVAGAIANSTWTESTTALPNGSYASIAYGSGYWVAVGGSGTAARSADGDTWSGVSIVSLGAGTYSSVVYGNGIFLAVATGTTNATAISTTLGNTWVAGGNLPANANWTSVAYGNGRFVAVASGGTNAAYSIDNGATWVASPAGLPSSQTWTSVSYGQGLFFAVASGTNVAATSPDGVNWTVRAMPTLSNWANVQFGNPSSTPIWTAISSTSGQVAASIRTGATAQGRVKVASNIVTEIRMTEPGSGYPHGNVTATTTSTNEITTSDTTNLVDSQPVEFTGLDAYGLSSNVTYYVIGSTIISNTSFKVALTAGSSTAVNLTTGTGLLGTYVAGPIATQVDPNKTRTAPTRQRVGTGVLGNPSFTNRGSANTTATANVTGDGFADLYQASNFVNVSGLFEQPIAGANVEFASIPNTWFKLVSVTNLIGDAGNYTATFQINPSLSVLNAPAHGDAITTRIKYSQVRLTGHDFLYIGTGNYSTTNYPTVDVSTAVTANQTLGSNGGRVFFTSTDQDGNFNVGNLFGVQQSTGTATLNASAFNLSGLQSLQLGTVSVGAGSAVITSFSTDPYFTANSDNILPTQKAIKSYITAQIGGGQSSLNVNTLTSGVIYVANNSISTTSGVQINVKAKMYFTGGVDGAPVALGFFMQR